MMQTMKLGRGGPAVSALGLGCMGMSPGAYGPADEAESIATIHAALEAGITLIDTGDFYGMGHNEMLIRRALEGRPRDRVIISVKFGALRDPAGMFVGNDSRPAAVKNFLAYSLQRLGVEAIDIYRPARLDPNVPIEDTVGAMAEMVKKGYIKHIGLSEVGSDTIRFTFNDAGSSANNRMLPAPSYGSAGVTLAQNDSLTIWWDACTSSKWRVFRPLELVIAFACIGSQTHTTGCSASRSADSGTSIVVFDSAHSAAARPARRPNVIVSMSELPPRRLAPCTDTHAHSPAA